MNLNQAFIRNSGSPCKMQRERHKWAIPMRPIVSMFIRMTDDVVVVMKDEGLVMSVERRASDIQF